MPADIEAGPTGQEVQNHNSGADQRQEDNRSLISLCMMVKDEQDRLPRLLDSVAPWVDEIIVVDTGSTDETPAIARRYGAQIQEHPWEQNFSKHRNQSISYAKGKWILILDADEELDQKTAPQLRNLAQNLPPDVGCLHVELYNTLPSGQQTMVTHPRMFRNDGFFHYEGPVHNTPIYQGKTAKSAVKLYHYGYNLDPATMEQKQKRREDMIGAWLEREPENYAAHSYMAQTLLSKPDARAQAAEHALTALRLAKEQGRPNVDFPRTYYPLIASLCHLGRDEEAIKYCLECIDIIPFYPDPYYFLTLTYLKQNRLEETCRAARQFVEAQKEAKAHPEKFRFLENMTVNHVGEALYRWSLAAACLGRDEEALETFKLLLEQETAEHHARHLIQGLLTASEGASLALQLSEILRRSSFDWPWVRMFYQLAKGRTNEPVANELKQAGLSHQARGEYPQALESLARAVELAPQDAQALLAMGRSFYEMGQRDEAETWLIKGLNASPGNPPEWKILGDILFEKEDYQGAAVSFERYQSLAQPGDDVVRGRLQVCQRRLAQSPAPPTVAQKPPRLLVFLVGGLSPQVVRLGGAYFSLNRAWGEFTSPAAGQYAPDVAGWAGLYTGVEQDRQGLMAEQSRQNPVSLKDLDAVSVWELIGRRYSLGLLAAPLGWPAPDMPGWAVAGYPAGLLHPGLARPAGLTPVLLAQGYRTDFLLSEFDDHTFAHSLMNSRPKEALLAQIERGKITAGLALPAVDVLVVGINFLERMQACFPQGDDRVFAAYQQVYGWMETCLAALKPQGYAVLSQRAYHPQNRRPQGGGFYCLSWLKGENLKARITDIAPEMLKFLDIDPAGLGAPHK